jgi:hypothetical protein
MPTLGSALRFSPAAKHRKEVDCFDFAALLAFQRRVTENRNGNVEEVFRSPVAHDSK